MEHKDGTHPEIAMVIENIEYIKIQRCNGIEYDSDGNIVTFNNNNEVCGDVPYVSKMPGYSGRARYCYHNAAENKTYYFDASFTLTEADDNKSGSAININDINYQKLYKQLIKDFGILIKANVNRKPLINMQKEFNKKYYKRIRYEFDKSFKLRNAYDYDNHDEIDIKTIDQKALYDEIYKDFGFLIKANDKKPMINLQWLFNKKYYKRFN